MVLYLSFGLNRSLGGIGSMGSTLAWSGNQFDICTQADGRAEDQTTIQARSRKS